MLQTQIYRESSYGHIYHSEIISLLYSIMSCAKIKMGNSSRKASSKSSEAAEYWYVRMILVALSSPTFPLLTFSSLQEQLDLEDLTYQSRRDEDGHHSQLLSDSSRIVIVIVKKPLIALRYQRSDGQVGSLPANGVYPDVS